MFATRISRKILSTALVSSSLIFTCLPEVVSAQTEIGQDKFRSEQYALTTGAVIPFNNSSVQTLRRIVVRSNCLSGNEAKYFSTQLAISRIEFSALFSKCFRRLIDKYPKGIFNNGNDLSLKEDEIRIRLLKYLSNIKKELKRIEVEFRAELILADEDLFSDTIRTKIVIPTINEKIAYLTYLRENQDRGRVKPDSLSREALEPVLHLTKIARCLPKEINLERYALQKLVNSNLSRMEVGYILNLCLDHLEEIYSKDSNNIFFTKKNLLLLRTVQEEFAAELAILRPNVDCNLSVFRSHILGYGCL